MKPRGIRISDIKDDKCVPLIEILETIPNGDKLKWAVLWLDVTPLENQGELIVELENKIKEQQDGLSFSWGSLKELSRKFFQEIEVTIVGCENKEGLHRYKEDQEMYETCDIVIEMIDGGFWEVFSKNPELINHFAARFKKVEFISSDFLL